MKHTPMLRTLTLVAPLVLAACGASRPAEPQQPADPAIVECRAEAQTNPDIRRIERGRMLGNPTNEARVNEERATLEQRLISDCLRRRGLTRGGGVEPVRRPGLF